MRIAIGHDGRTDPVRYDNTLTDNRHIAATVRNHRVIIRLFALRNLRRIDHRMRKRIGLESPKTAQLRVIHYESLILVT